jgi:MFS family permease
VHPSTDTGSPSSAAPSAIAGHGNPRRLLATLTIGHMSQGLAFTAFVAALPQMARDLGPRGELIAQMTMALASFGLLAGSLLSGWILEKAGARRSLLGFIALYGLAGSGGCFLHDPALLLLTRFAVGFAAACLVTTCLWGIAAEYSGAARAHRLGIVNSMAPLMALLATLGGGLLAQAGGWHLAFALYPAFGLASFALALPTMKHLEVQQPQASTVRQHYFKQLLPLYLLGAGFFTVIFMGSTQFTFLLQEDGVRNPSTISLILSLATLVTTLISFGYGWAHQHLGPRGTLLLALIAASIALSIIGAGRSVASATLGVCLLGIFTGLAAPYLYHTVTERTDPLIRGRAVGVLNAFNFLGGFLNPVLLAPLGRQVGFHRSFLLVAAVMAALSLLCLAGLRRATPSAAVVTGHE